MDFQTFVRRHERTLKIGVFFAVVTLFWTSLLVAGQGFRQVEKEYRCYSEVTVCRGIPTESCIGIETHEVESRECAFTESIETLCSKKGEYACFNGTEANNTIMGKSCDFWRKAMDMEERSCS